MSGYNLAYVGSQRMEKGSGCILGHSTKEASGNHCVIKLSAIVGWMNCGTS